MTLMINVSCTGSDRSKRIELQDGDELNIGRSFDDASLIVDARLSRKHFSIHYANGKIIITHLSKTNPTLIASEGSSDFEKVRGERIEHDGCRIIAGSHRFVLQVVKPDSVRNDDFADELHTEESAQQESSRFWSDVDSIAAEPPQAQHHFSDDPIPTAGSASRETLPSHDVRDDEDAKKQKATHLFDDDDSFDSGKSESRAETETVKQLKAPKKKAAKPDPVKKDPPKSVTKKPFFPVTDDFFDD